MPRSKRRRGSLTRPQLVCMPWARRSRQARTRITIRPGLWADEVYHHRNQPPGASRRLWATPGPRACRAALCRQARVRGRLAAEGVALGEPLPGHYQSGRGCPAVRVALAAPRGPAPPRWRTAWSDAGLLVRAAAVPRQAARASRGRPRSPIDSRRLADRCRAKQRWPAQQIVLAQTLPSPAIGERPPKPRPWR